MYIFCQLLEKIFCLQNLIIFIVVKFTTTGTGTKKGKTTNFFTYFLFLVDVGSGI
jgi:hypothetical protein